MFSFDFILYFNLINQLKRFRMINLVISDSKQYFQYLYWNFYFGFCEDQHDCNYFQFDFSFLKYFESLVYFDLNRLPILVLRLFSKNIS